MKKLFLSLLVVCGLFGAYSSVQAATYTVCVEEGCDASTIAAGLALVNTVTGGDVLQILSSYNTSGESYPITMPDVTTTIACDEGAVIGQMDPMALSATINISTGSTIRNCTFGNIQLNTKNVGMTATAPTGFRIENNIFSTTATSSIYLYQGGTDFVIQGNRNINYLTVDSAKQVERGVIQDNTFYGRVTPGALGYIVSTSASSTDLAFLNNEFIGHASDITGVATAPIVILGTNIIFATNTVQYIGGAPAGLSQSIILNADGENYVGGNKIVSPNESGCNGIALYPSDGAGAVTMSYVFNQNTLILKCGGDPAATLAVRDAGNAEVVMRVTTTHSLFLGGGRSPKAILLDKSAPGSVIDFSNDWNGYYGFTQAITSAGDGMSFTLSDHSFYRDPILMTDDAIDTNDFDIAPFSFYRHPYGEVAIGATTGTRRNTTTIVQGGTIDYIDVDATTTEKIPAYISSSDTVTIGAGSYRSFDVDDANVLHDVTIQGIGPETSIDARENENGITFANVTSSAIKMLNVLNASSTASTYALHQMIFDHGETHYGEAIEGFDLPMNSPLVLGSTSCDFYSYADGEDATDLVRGGSQNWHVALAVIGGTYHETLVIPGDLASSMGDLNTLCAASEIPVSFDYFITDAFVRTDGSFAYSSSAVTDAGATLDPSFETPAITRTQSVHAGLKLINSGSITISQVTSTNNGYGIWFADSSAFGNTVSSSLLGANTLYDVRHEASGRNTFDNTSFDRASTSVTGLGELFVLFNARVRALEAGTATALMDASVTTTSAIPLVTPFDTTDASGYTPYLSLPAYTLTSTTLAETSGGYNPRLFAASLAGYNVTSTLENLHAVNQTVVLGLVSSALPEAATGLTISAIGTTTSTLSWTDTSENEDGFYVQVISTTTGESFSSVTLSANATSYEFTGLTPSQPYIATVRPFNSNGAAVVAVSPHFVTVPVTPTPPDLHGMSLTSVAIARVQANGNGTSTEYAIYDVRASQYRDASGVATTTAVWQTTSTWDVLLISGLTCGTSYGFATRARNTNHDESATSTVANVSTVDCPPVVSSGGGGGGGGGSLTAPIGSLFAPSPIPVPPVVPSTIPVTVNPAIPLQILTIQDFIERGSSPASKKLGSGERAALVTDARETMQILSPSIEDLDRLANGQIPRYRNVQAEQEQLPRVRRAFRRMFGHDPDFKNPMQNLAWNTLMYRIRFPRDLVAEKRGILAYKKLFATNPSQPFQWAVVRVLGYVQR